eukprot:11208590-Lingulodinium_polyedra.AAC.1
MVASECLNNNSPLSHQPGEGIPQLRQLRERAVARRCSHDRPISGRPPAGGPSGTCPLRRRRRGGARETRHRGAGLS